MTRKKIIRAIITIVGVILAIYFSKVISIYLTNKNGNTDIRPKEYLSKLADKINKQHNVPIMIDKETKFMGVSADDGKLIFEHTMINYTAEEMKKIKLVSRIKDSMKSTACKDEDHSRYLKKGVSLVYSYHGRNGDWIGSFSITPEECGY